MTKPAAIIIGRNEVARLEQCLASAAKLSPIIYVDSGSTDGSVQTAEAAGAEVVELDLSAPFTAARARNAGLKRLQEIDPDGAFVQFLDGDTEIRDGWIEASMMPLENNPACAVVCGRRRERFPDASVFNKLVDQEWDTPVGPTTACGGDALMRRSALRDVGGYNDALIAGEEPEMCLRLARAGWSILRIDAEMTWHDIAMTQPGQWWQRTKRAGYAFAEGAAMHGTGPERYNLRPTLRAVLWGIVLPLLAFFGLIFSGWVGLLFLAYPAQVLRLMLRGQSSAEALALVVGKFAEAQGVLGYALGRLTRQKSGIIEYK